MDTTFERIQFITTAELQERFRRGHLARQWARAYPMLFDADDRRLARNQREYGYHYHEWLAAILLFHTRGLLSLVKKYPYTAHVYKQQVLERLVSPDVLNALRECAKGGRAQPPDLLVYNPDHQDWFFCEVKGPRDKLRPGQETFFRQLAEKTGRRVTIVDLHVVPGLAKERSARNRNLRLRGSRA